MLDSPAPARLTPRLTDALYTEALVLVDEARACFEADRASAHDGLSARQRVAMACESLKVTTRLMHVIAWLMSQRARDGDGMSARRVPAKLGVASVSSQADYADLPVLARQIIEQSIDLYARVSRIAVAPVEWHAAMPFSPARSLLHRLERAY